MPRNLFRHVARWNEGWSRIEMHLEALDDISFTVAGQAMTMQRGETIHTENSHKYDSRSARQLLAAGGWTALREWTDGLFSLFLAEARPEPLAP